MELDFALILVVLGVICFVIALLEGRIQAHNDDDQEEKDYFMIIFLAISTGLFILGGIIFLSPSETFYSITSDTLETIYYRDYWPYAYFFIGWGILSLLLTSGKAMERLGAGENQ